MLKWLKRKIKRQYENKAVKDNAEVKMAKKNDRLIIVDYPGSTGINNHANAFAHCGSMNNLVFFLLNDRAPDKQAKEQILKARQIMNCTGDAKIVFCINQAAAKLRRRQKELETDVMRNAKDI